MIRIAFDLSVKDTTERSCPYSIAQAGNVHEAGAENSKGFRGGRNNHCPLVVTRVLDPAVQYEIRLPALWPSHQSAISVKCHIVLSPCLPYHRVSSLMKNAGHNDIRPGFEKVNGIRERIAQYPANVFEHLGIYSRIFFYDSKPGFNLIDEFHPQAGTFFFIPFIRLLHVIFSFLTKNKHGDFNR